jgi:hypothetical protein
LKVAVRRGAEREIVVLQFLRWLLLRIWLWHEVLVVKIEDATSCLAQQNEAVRTPRDTAARDKVIYQFVELVARIRPFTRR